MRDRTENNRIGLLRGLSCVAVASAVMLLLPPEAASVPRVQNVGGAALNETQSGLRAFAGLGTTAVAAKQRSIPVMVQTIPELPGAEFSLNGKAFRADKNGLALVVVPAPGKYELRILSEKVSRQGGRYRFSLWSDGKRKTTRSVTVRSFTYLQAGFENTRAILFKFFVNDGSAIDPTDIDSINVTDPDGGETRLSGAGPHRLIATSPATDGESLALKPSVYRVNAVIIDGRNVLDERVTVNPSKTETPRIELALSSAAAAAPPAAQEPEVSDSPSGLPSVLLITLLGIVAAAVLLLLAGKLHVVAVTKGVVTRARSWSPGSRLRRLTPSPAMSGLRRLNPKGAVRYVQRLNPSPRLASGIRKFRDKRRTKAMTAPKSKAKEVRRPHPRVKKAPKPIAKKTPRPKKKVPKARNRTLNPLGVFTTGIRKRRLRAQLNSLGRGDPGSKVWKRHARKGPSTALKSPRGVALLWLRGSSSSGSLRGYGPGPKVRIKLRNGHLVIGTIRRTRSHVNQDALNIFVERVYDQFGKEMLNSSEDSFILPSQIVRIEKYENKVIRLPEPEVEGRGGAGGEPSDDRKRNVDRH